MCILDKNKKSKIQRAVDEIEGIVKQNNNNTEKYEISIDKGKLYVTTVHDEDVTDDIEIMAWFDEGLFSSEGRVSLNDSEYVKQVCEEFAEVVEQQINTQLTEWQYVGYYPPSQTFSASGKVNS